MYGGGVERNLYYETTIYGKDEETLPLHEVSVAYEQREPWGSLQARTEWSEYPSRPVEDAARARRGILTARRTGPVGIDKRQCLANPRSTGAPGTRGDRRGDPAAHPPSPDRLRASRRGQRDLHVRVDLQLRRQSTIRAVGAGDAEREPDDLVKWLVPLAAACLILLLPVPDGLTPAAWRAPPCSCSWWSA